MHAPANHADKPSIPQSGIGIECKAEQCWDDATLSMHESHPGETDNRETAQIRRFPWQIVQCTKTDFVFLGQSTVLR